MLKMHSSKKALGLVELFSWFLMLLFTVVFFIFFNLAGCGSGPAQQKIMSEKLLDTKMNYELSAFLMTPAVYEGAQFTNADLLVLAFSNALEKKSLANEEAYSTNVFSTAEASEFLAMLDSYYARDNDKPLTASAINFMKAYADFIPQSVSRGFYCSVYMAADKYTGDGKLESSLKIFDTSYKGIVGKVACSADFVVAEAKIPAYNGYISLQIRSKFNVAKLSAKVYATVLSVGVSGMLPLPAALVVYYLWF